MRHNRQRRFRFRRDKADRLHKAGFPLHLVQHLPAFGTTESVLPLHQHNLHTDQIHDGILHITQRKTKARLRFEISGLLFEIISRRAPENGGYLFKNSRGGRLTRDVLGRHFLALRKQLQTEHPELAEELANFQFRDLRAKSGTDAYLMTGDKNAARQQLGHTTEAMTNRYIRQEKVLKPLK